MALGRFVTGTMLEVDDARTLLRLPPDSCTGSLATLTAWRGATRDTRAEMGITPVESSGTTITSAAAIDSTTNASAMGQRLRCSRPGDESSNVSRNIFSSRLRGIDTAGTLGCSMCAQNKMAVLTDGRSRNQEQLRLLRCRCGTRRGSRRFAGGRCLGCGRSCYRTFSIESIHQFLGDIAALARP